MFSSALKSFSSNISASYTISGHPTSTAGAWKVFDGKKKSTGKGVSIFVFDRRSLELPGGGLQSRADGAARKRIHDEVVERLKKEANSLARLRHPSILELAEPVEDTRNGGLMFATEPIIATLGGLLESKNSETRNGGGRTVHNRADGVVDDIREVELDELEIQKGMLQLAKGLQFLHESAGLIHGNLTPDAVYVNHKSDWKISGLGFSGPPDVSTSTTPSMAPPIALSELLYYDPRLPRTVQLNIDYTSPDFVMDTNISSAADMFSLGLIIIALYNVPHESPLRTNGNVSIYKKIFTSSSTIPSAANNFLSSKPVPPQLASEVLPRLITRRPASRMNAREFQESRFFDNILVSAIRFLDTFPTKTQNEKSQFMKGLPRIIDQFPSSVLDKKVLPALLEETKDREMLAIILSNVFKILKILPSSQRAFADKVLPRLREVFAPTGNKTERDSLKEAALVVVLENLSEIAKLAPGKTFKADILPIVYLGLDSSTSTIIDKALNCLPIILAILDFSTIKNEVFPIVASVFSKTSSLTIKVRGLEALDSLCGGGPGPNPGPGPDSGSSTTARANSSAILDKFTIQEKVVPLLKVIKTKEPAVMMAALAVFRSIGAICDHEFLAIEILPVLWNFALGPLLNLQQFQEYMALIKTMSARIEQEQTRRLRELATNPTNGFGSSRAPDFMGAGPSNDAVGDGDPGEDDFERLVLGKASKGSMDTRTEPVPSSISQPTKSPLPVTQRFAWQDNGGSSMSNLMQAPHGSRAITPDQTLSNFATLVPSQPSHIPLQPSNQTTNMWTIPPVVKAATPVAYAGNSPQNTAPGIDWGKATQQQMMANTMRPTTFTQQTPRQQTKGFALAPPPAQTPKKTGLDGYESLI